MDLEWIAAVSSFAVAMAGTPGPNNMMATASGANYGFRRTMPFICGVTIAVAAIILVAAAVGSPLMADSRMRGIVKWAGLFYLLWLAWQIGSARPEMKNPGDCKDTGDRPLTWMQGALFQLVNPKLWAMVAGAVVAYGSTAHDHGTLAIALGFAFIFGIATFASTAAWTLVGLGAGRFLRTERAMRLFNWSMAFMLVMSLVPVLTE
ncbi:LysE family translocator [Phyllobacterium salinisoli]|uniref:LysE family translocator n=1 Tax=Phyllobacterium salinisoli TaxID=1899321 RepID=A0A368JYH7_9HYPH|nr:LysE family translocator [Phyllobacterium salinisoli]RCS22198.1 LysE family translocator [Phyllobacterium salinisoli]